MAKSLRVLELSAQLQQSADDMIAVCALLDIPATSIISCLTEESAQKIINYYERTI